MGLSCKQVISTSDGLDWSQTFLQAQTNNLQLPKPTSMRRQQQQNHEQQQSEALKCPRCDSSNTKFCYYNNYNKSQPRHFCRACKRHWTKGGTLRNVPVGGGRKNKRPKRSSKSSAAAAGNSNTDGNRLSPHLTSEGHHDQQQQRQNNNLSLALGGREKNNNVSEIFYQALIGSNTNSNTSFLLSNLPTSSQDPQSLNFPLISDSASFYSKNSSIVSTSFLTSDNVYNYVDHQDFKTMSEPSNTGIVPSTAQPWQVPTTATASSGMDMMSNCWNWEDIDNLVSTDLKLPWDDSDIKP